MADEFKMADVGTQVAMPAGEHIARHKNRANPKPQAPTRVTLAFGNLAQPVLVEKMGSEDDEIVRNALAAVVRLFKVPLNVVKSVAAGGIQRLTQLTQHADTEIRRRASKALELLMLTPSAKRSVCADRACLPALAAVLDDGDETVRLNLSQGLVNLSSSVEGAEALVECGYVKLLVRKAGKDASTEVQKRALIVLNKCTNVIGGRGLSDSLAHGAARCCIGLLKHDSTDIRHLVRVSTPQCHVPTSSHVVLALTCAAHVVAALFCVSFCCALCLLCCWMQAAFNLASLAFSPEGKLQAIRGGAVPLLLGIMTDRDERVRASAAAAMMGIVTDDSGKEAVIEAGIDALVACLQDTNTLVTLNTLKVILGENMSLRCAAEVGSHPCVCGCPGCGYGGCAPEGQSDAPGSRCSVNDGSNCRGWGGHASPKCQNSDCRGEVDPVVSLFRVTCAARAGWTVLNITHLLRD